MAVLDSRQATALWITQPGRAELRTEPLPPAAADEVRVRTRYSAISRGTERLVFNGQVPPVEHQRMRCPFQAGDFPGPVKYGYSAVGVAENGPLAGQWVYCLHPHQDLFQVPATALVPVPAGTDPRRAVLAANLETAINALWDVPVRVGAQVRVVGAGMIGALVAYLAVRTAGARVQLIDVAPQRQALAQALGVAFAMPEQAQDQADVVFHASASAAGLATALRLAGREAEVVELSWYGDQPVPVPLGANFHALRLRLISSQVGQVAPAQRPRWEPRRRLALALELLADPTLDVLLAPPQPFSQAPQVLAEICRSQDPALCQVLDYQDSFHEGENHVQRHRQPALHDRP
jgi:threonine dehydrogenase-like Zn-dependent dehydrogenase